MFIAEKKLTQNEAVEEIVNDYLMVQFLIKYEVNSHTTLVSNLSSSKSTNMEII